MPNHTRTLQQIVMDMHRLNERASDFMAPEMTCRQLQKATEQIAEPSIVTLGKIGHIREGYIARHTETDRPLPGRDTAGNVM